MFKTIFLFLFIAIVNHSNAQQQIDIDADYDRVARFEFISPGNYIGAYNYNTDMSLPQEAYYEKSAEKRFVLMQWNIPNNIIPDGATIDFVELKFYYDSNQLNYSLSHYNVDITNATLPFTDYGDIRSNEIYQSVADPSGWTTSNSDEYPEMKNVVKNSLPNDRVTFIIEKVSEYNVPGKVSYPSLKITFTPPQQTVTVKQKLSTGNEFGEIGHWENNSWQSYSSGNTFSFEVNSDEYFEAETDLYNSEKFNNWNDNSYILNYLDFNVEEGLDFITALFKPTYSGIQLKNNLENSNYNASDDVITFKDPWLRDLSDEKGTRNRGSNSVMNSYPSPFQITISGEHQGVFLNQGYENGVWNPPYYTVKAEDGQTVNINGKDHKFYFQHWEASGNGADATFEDANSVETPVVFNNSTATVSAVMKGTQLSDDAGAYTFGAARKVMILPNGNRYMIYESMGGVWMEEDLANGTHLGPDNLSNNGKSPSFALDYSYGKENYFYVVYQKTLTDNSSEIFIEHWGPSALLSTYSVKTFTH